jgi:hypothetical protein
MQANTEGKAIEEMCSRNRSINEFAMLMRVANADGDSIYLLY